MSGKLKSCMTPMTDRAAYERLEELWLDTPSGRVELINEEGKQLPILDIYESDNTITIITQ